MSYFQEPVENITDAQFSNIIVVTITIGYGESSESLFWVRANISLVLK